MSTNRISASSAATTAKKSGITPLPPRPNAIATPVPPSLPPRQRRRHSRPALAVCPRIPHLRQQRPKAVRLHVKPRRHTPIHAPLLQRHIAVLPRPTHTPRRPITRHYYLASPP